MAAGAVAKTFFGPYTGRKSAACDLYRGRGVELVSFLQKAASNQQALKPWRKAFNLRAPARAVPVVAPVRT